MDKTSIYLLKNFEGLGTRWYIELFEHEGDGVEEVKNDIENYITDFNNRFTRFNHLSKLSELNRDGETGYDIDLEQMLSIGEKVQQKTHGVFDMFIKMDMERSGYGSNHFHNKKRKKLDEQLRYNIHENVITLTTEKEIDLGGIGKGYLIDKLAERLRNVHGYKYFLINGGGDIFATSDNDQPIDVLLQHPTEREQYIGAISLKNQSLCCSSSYVRTWLQNGKTKNHLFDPLDTAKTIQAASYVIADCACTADMYATVCCLEDNEEVLRSLAKDEQFEYMRVNTDMSWYETTGFERLRKEI